LQQIGGRLHRSPNTIRLWLKEYNIEIRSRSESITLWHGKSKPSKEELKQLYWVEKLSTHKIANLFNVSGFTIAIWMREYSIPLRSASEAMKARGLSGSSSPQWRGGRTVKGGGYVVIHQPDHRRASKQGYVAEHILVWEQIHRRPLPKGWVIHHLNGIKSDNRPSNLVALATGKHAERHQRLLLALKEHIRALEAENRQLRRALEDSQGIFYITEN
jgi:transposase